MTRWIPVALATGVLGVRAAAADATVTTDQLADGAAVRLTVEADLSRHRVLQPLALAPDARVTVGRRVAIALTHSRRAAGWSGAGGGLCVRASRETLGAMAPACDERVAEPKASVLVGATRHLVVRGGVALRGWADPAASLVAGATFAGTRARWSMRVGPQISVPIVDGAARARAGIAVVVTRRIGAFDAHATTGIEGALATFDETFAVPLGIAGSWRIGRIEIGAGVTLDRALGALNATSWRSSYAFLGARG